jgi:hypothetical protein
MNRSTYDSHRTFYPKTVDVFAKVAFGAAGAPTLDAAASRGVISVTRNAAGKFTFLFGSKVNKANQLDQYVRLAAASAVFDTAGAAGAPAASPSMQVIDNQIADGKKAYIQVMLTDLETPAATDPAQNEVGYFRFTFIDTKAG